MQETTLHVGTFDLLNLLTTEEPDAEFTFCMGADTFMDLTDWKWKRSKDVMRLLEGRIVVFSRRRGRQEQAIECHGNGVDEQDSQFMLEKRVSAMNNGIGGAPAANVRIMQLDTTAATTAITGAAAASATALCGNVSSTQIRSIRSREELKGLVTPQIEDFIVTNKLYGFAGTGGDDFK